MLWTRSVLPPDRAAGHKDGEEEIAGSKGPRKLFLSKERTVLSDDSSSF